MSTISSSRIAACIEYCGKNYCGWQRQPHSPSVQEAVEKAISIVANENINVISAGRTDAGVHAIGQMIHFDTISQRSEYEWLRGINTYLPHDISLCWTHAVDPTFHARFAAIERRYRYIFLTRTVSPSYLHGIVSWYPLKFDVQLMQKAGNVLLGRHNFNAFRSVSCQSKNPIKEIKKLKVTCYESWVWIDIIADGFLHHMVRNIAGVLIKIGGKLAPLEWAKEVLNSQDRTQAWITASSEGLYFVSAKYSHHYGLPDTPPVCKFW